MASVVSSSIFSPRPLMSLMPLSANGLCDAEIITPQSKLSTRVTYATEGVVVTCSM